MSSLDKDIFIEVPDEKQGNSTVFINSNKTEKVYKGTGL